MTPYTADEQTYLIATHHTHSVRQQAQALGRTPHSITSKRRKLLRAGLVTPARRNWTAGEVADVLEGLQDGYAVATVAQRLGTRSAEAIRVILPRRQLPIHAVRGGPIAVRSPLAVAHLFGVHAHVVYDWLRDRLLFARRSRPGKTKRYAQHLISDESLLKFIHDRRTWFRFDPSRITCPDWRRAATEARTGGRWVDVNELAVLLCCSAAYARALVRVGALPYERARHSRQWYVWLPDGVTPRLKDLV